MSACKQDTQITPPFEVAAMTSKNGRGQSSDKESGSIENRNNLVSREEELSTSGEEQPADVFDGDFLHTKVHKRQTALLLQKFENSHFFVRISESNEPLWSKRSSVESFSNSSETHSQKAPTIKTKENALPSIGTVIDKGNFDATVCGGTARNSVKCFALPNGDIVVCIATFGNYVHAINFFKVGRETEILFVWTLKFIVRWQWQQRRSFDYPKKEIVFNMWYNLHLKKIKVYFYI